jgi:hypothetical protein
MPVRLAAPCDVMPAAEQAGLELLGQAGMVAVRAADLRSPAGAGLGKDGADRADDRRGGADPEISIRLDRARHRQRALRRGDRVVQP